MAIHEHIEKRELVITLGGAYDAATGGEIPASFRWEAVRFLKNDDGSEAAPPQNVRIPATAEEVAEHIDARVPALIADVKENAARNDALRAENDALKGALSAMREAEKYWTANARQRVDEALERAVAEMQLGDEDYEHRVAGKLEKALPYLSTE